MSLLGYKVVDKALVYRVLVCRQKSKEKRKDSVHDVGGEEHNHDYNWEAVVTPVDSVKQIDCRYQIE